MLHSLPHFSIFSHHSPVSPTILCLFKNSLCLPVFLSRSQFPTISCLSHNSMFSPTILYLSCNSLLQFRFKNSLSHNSLFLLQFSILSHNYLLLVNSYICLNLFLDSIFPITICLFLFNYHIYQLHLIMLALIWQNLAFSILIFFNALTLLRRLVFHPRNK